MTTKITVDAHAGWDVAVELHSLDERGAIRDVQSETVKANTVRDFYIHSHLIIAHVSEVKKE